MTQKENIIETAEAMMVPCEMWEKPLIKVEIGEDTYIYTPSKSNPMTSIRKPEICFQLHGKDITCLSAKKD